MNTANGLRIQVLRTTVVRVSGPLGGNAERDLRNILFDLIHNHGISELVVDLSEATNLTSEISDVLEEAQQSFSSRSGHIEIRLADSSALPELSELPDEIAAFVPLEHDTEDGG